MNNILQQQLKEIFESDYPGAISFVDNVIRKVLPNENYVELPAPINILEEKRHEAILDSGITAAFRIGEVDTYKPIYVYDVTLSNSTDIAKSKVAIQRFVRSHLLYNTQAFILFHYENPEGRSWRFSYLYKEDSLTNTTSAKRYTYLFGNKHLARTASERFAELSEKKVEDAKPLLEAFSVEALTKQFYNDLFDWYTWALEVETGVYFPNNPKIKADDRENLDTKMIRLITRLMFVWFIKQKGLVPDSLFKENNINKWLKDFDAQSMTSGNYYQAILQNLFFATLNRPIKTPLFDKDGNQVGEERRQFAKRKDAADVKSLYRYQELFKINEDEILSVFEKIPFINGGLFECLDKNKTIDGVEQAYFHDGFSRNANISQGHWTHRAFIPNKLFFDPNRGIISIFTRYNFTVEENSPSEQQIALDPELLGKVFENLLGAYNKETRDTARNQSGSFYTPREIVQYMVDRSLEAYLGNTDEAKALFRDDFVYDKGKRAYYDEVIAKLKVIKVLDPACGSGAFPIGMLNRIVEVMQNLKAPGTTYDLKLQIMENCIYGGDIQAIAAQITKLRFFISLVCDCEKTDNADENYGIPNLPNLETHFVTCDSLIGLKRTTEASLFELDVIELKKKLQEIRHEHFTAKTVYKKNQLRDRDKELRDELAIMLQSDDVYASEDAKQMSKWNPYDQNCKSPFFDPEWMFGIKDGFDVVIGNPPYIQLQTDNGKLAKEYETCGYKTFSRMGDIYSLFYERGWQLLNVNGILCYITSNKWMRAGYGEKTRKFFCENTNPCLLIDFAGVQIFDSATVDTNILLFTKSKNKGQTKCVAVTKENKDKVSSNLSLYIMQNCGISKFDSSECWNIIDDEYEELKRKIEKQGIQLNKWDIRINYGLKTGFNDAFWITNDQKETILTSCSTVEEREKTKEILKPLLRGRDISKYKVDWSTKWLIWIPWHFPYHLDSDIVGASTKAEEAFKSSYPTLYNYLSRFEGKLKSRNKAETGKRYEWYVLQRWGANYWQDFDSPKIVYPNMTKYMPFYYDTQGYFGNDKSFMIAGKHISYLAAFLNSSLFKFCFKEKFPELLGGTRELRKIFFDKIPVKDVDDVTDGIFRELVNDIQNEYSDEKAKNIDKMIFDIYGLTQEERDAIGYIDFHNSNDDTDDYDE